MSSRAVDYTIRAAKAVERKMIVEMLGRMSYFHPMRDYEYVGFGAIYFADFRLIHRSLGIGSMLSIEQDKTSLDRYEANRPFQCIRVKGGWAGSVLPAEVDWSRPVIAWLDFDGKLGRDRLDEIAIVCDRCLPGSALIVTVNVTPDIPLEGKAKDFVARVGSESLPELPEDLDLAVWGEAKYARMAISTTVQSVLKTRNSGVEPGRHMEYHQLWHFHYSDRAKMLTVGGVLLQAGERKKLTDAQFDHFDQYRAGDEPLHLAMPHLTHREIRLLDRKLPTDPATLNLPGVPEADIRRYADLYRYFPVFVDVDV